ncbi:hypothetical protein ACF1AJ_20325 [Leifsonia sp. NPDC014704]|uniref:hypothetical protein n=2 Tax=unclassified Leifsonia TaxID=2663824 RepID=UPI000A19B208
MVEREKRTMSTLITDTDDVTRFCGVFSDVTLAHDVATMLGCREAEALAGILRALGEPAAADMWLDAHAHGDEPGDQHYQAAPEPCIVPIDPMEDLQCDSCQ